ncbi:Vacuolar protein sorting-associated protein vps5 [Coemansia sp. RSA 2320]|nr:Vacuolar protein sorting-associated protein vps5 [Coemansia sp. RSA 2320]
MDDGDVFGGGFGGSSQRAFTFATEEMNPFEDSDSPWGAAPATTHVPPDASSKSDQASGEDDDEDGDEDEGGENENRPGETEDLQPPDSTDGLRQAAERLRISTQPADLAAAPAASADSTANAQSSGLGAPPVQTARRVGIIKRGLRSPRVLGKQLSPTSLEDPLSSAVVRTEEQPATHPGEQQQSRSFDQPRPHAQPHPYDQQLSPPLQHEQIASARQHVEAPRQQTADRPAAASPARQPASRAYLAAHQRRRSLDPTPPEQMPVFCIYVTEPVKVSDALKSYIAYKVLTQSDAAMFRERDMAVRRRYRDFDWLIQELVARHPGVIVPPIPEKQSMGRFEDEFVEARRAALESCLMRISQHPVLWCDDVFRLFLEADDFATKARVITENRISAEINGTGPPLSGSGAGAGAGGSGSSGSLFGDAWGAAKYKEKDEWFARRMHELDAVEEELRALLRALEYSQRQRLELSIVHGELSEAYLKMAGQELSKSLSNGLTDMGSLQQKLKALQSRQGVADFADFQLATDEYIRLIASVRTALAARARAHGLWQTSLADLIKRRKVLEGYVQNPSRASPERMSQLKAEIARAEIRTEGNRNAFDDVSLLLKHEIARFDAARVRDFQAAIETYLTSLIDTQEEIVTLWDAYLTSLRNTEHPTDTRLSS